MATITVHTPEQAAALEDDVRRVWEACFAVPGGEQWSGEQFRDGLTCDGYRLVTAAEDGAGSGGAVVGFAHGFDGDVDDDVPQRLARRVGAQVLDEVGEHFQVVELGVLPTARRLGLGAALHDALLASTQHRRALLVTSPDDDDPGVRLYLSRGWRTLGLLEEGSRVMRWERASSPGPLHP